MSVSSSSLSPPPPPPPPPPEDLQSKISPFVLKMRSAPPQTGLYFFYGTLMDPKILADILDLDHEPKLRPAKVVGYACKLWGQYPAMVDGPQDATVEGAVYNVQTVKDGEKLAAYETNHYQTKACLIEYMDSQEPVDDLGHTFMFVGDSRDLTEGTFNLQTWLERMGRQKNTKH
ncbi:gamma-glutamylcyclotransferase family protein [Aspergillus clavatus NRRL 1]|uniref:Putative gamma-glutamylcyclotransferase n=1 Tax=Aspergillus clavatus (strain ATCC 1007 / CBS 513.65 / DSM 816 / NCTC 3887 / NRRL 1 / QM 1276 / 107) TaxID=344612 RepID=A1C7H7_ASPCL|nr:uncharacterized protein ACLA_073840 [Aspergillus clavatus NRRL 1]EAW14348.1 conserved hypothetical protein [Aspergillus clavatus NRRL 1]